MRSLRVLHVNASDRAGGAARAAYRIHLAQRKIGIDSNMLVVHSSEAEQNIHSPLRGRRQTVHRVKAFVAGKIVSFQRTPTNQVLHSINRFASGLADWINSSDYDLVNLHWLGGEVISVEEIGLLQKPVFWTMHDMWPISGAEHYDDLTYPGRYKSDYEQSNRPAGYSGPDLDAWVWARKRRAWQGRHFHLISPSRWLANCAAESSLMRNQSCVVIPNCIDTDIFKPIDRVVALRILNLDPEKRYILFGAMSSTSDRRKGFHLLQPAMQILANKEKIKASTEVLVFGASAPVVPPELGLPVRYLGHFHDELSLALLYCASSIFVAPSMQDNLPNTVVEAMSCGTPCVAFGIGGMVDLISSESRGLLASPFDIESLAKLMESLLLAQNLEGRRSICSASAQAEYSQIRVAERYGRYYEDLLADRSTK